MSYMDITSTVRNGLIRRLWEKYSISNYALEIAHLNHKIILDHIAIIDLGFESSNRMELANLFQELGFEIKGEGYLPEKNNDFLWMSQKNSSELLTEDVAPQIVFGDFRIEKLSNEVRNIVEKYGSYQKKFDLDKFNALMSKNLAHEAIEFIFSYLEYKSWPLITKKEYKLVEKENPLLAWVLMFGRTVNHFGVDVQFSAKYNGLSEFHEDAAKILDYGIGMIKGSKEIGIEQSSSLGKIIHLDDIDVLTRGPFLEFVWRHPIKDNPILWGDYYRGFIPDNANKIIESVYL